MWVCVSARACICESESESETKKQREKGIEIKSINEWQDTCIFVQDFKM